MVFPLFGYWDGFYNPSTRNTWKLPLHMGSLVTKHLAVWEKGKCNIMSEQNVRLLPLCWSSCTRKPWEWMDAVSLSCLSSLLTNQLTSPHLRSRWPPNLQGMYGSRAPEKYLLIKQWRVRSQWLSGNRWKFQHSGTSTMTRMCYQPGTSRASTHSHGC